MSCSSSAPSSFEEHTILLRQHLVSISDVIVRTRQEIAELYDKHKSGRTRDELNAVVQGTEQATETILTAAETVDALAQRIAQRTPDSAITADIEAIHGEVQTIFEACSFQDLTGQRISKVVRTIVLIEERIGELLHLWDVSRGTYASGKPAAVKRTDDEALLNGPVLPGDATVSQDAVDALFP